MRPLFQVLGFLLRASKDIPHARLTMSFVILAGVVSGVASSAMIMMVSNYVNGKGTGVMGLGWVFAALCVLLPLFRFLSQTMLINLTQKSLRIMRVRLGQRILSAPLRHLEKVGASKLLATLTTDVATLVDALGMVPGIFMYAAIVVSCLIFLGWISWTVLLQIAVFFVIGIVSYQLPVIKAMGYMQRARELHNSMIGYVRAMVEGTKELKMHNARRSSFLQAFDGSVGDLQREMRIGSTIFVAAASWGHVLFFVVIGLLIFVFPSYQTISPDVIGRYTLTLFFMMTPLEALMQQIPAFGRAAIALRMVEELGFSLEQEARERPLQSEVAPQWNRLDIAGVTHSYRRENVDESFELGPINLSFAPGEMIFIVGGNGSGKTTLAKLLLGLYAPEKGEIRFNGQVISDENREWYREHFSAVFVDFFIFEKLLGLDASSLDDNARKYLRQLHLEQKVQVKDGALSTVDLSQGQRKRLALLTAYLEDRPIYLFDEWAADQDPIFKEIFYLELLPELKSRGKTVFVISHDDRYYYVADRILKLDYGKIVSDRSMTEFLDSLTTEPGSFRTHEAGA